MAWEWLAPTGTLLGTVVGGLIGGGYARGTQKRQHRFDRRKAVDEQGREKATEAVAALRFLQRHNDEVVNWSMSAPPGDLSDTQEQLDRLGQAVVFLTDDQARSQVELVHNVITDNFVADRFGRHDYASAAVMVWVACREGLEVLGRYLRDEPSQPPSEQLQKLRTAYDSGHDEMARQHEEWEQERTQKTARKPDVTPPEKS
ncbi:hypothetical protein [Lentzea sp. NPDC092896]|uniref:hypothetical protein n=1 Tax=Lentzea sp. NPDC092896 TaxID=3364127 RepID=UPI00380812A8